VTQLFLEVLAGNDAALALYASSGFERQGHRRDYYGPGLDAIVLRHRLRGHHHADDVAASDADRGTSNGKVATPESEGDVAASHEQQAVDVAPDHDAAASAGSASDAEAGDGVSSESGGGAS
jgi:hypothetical protein